MKLVLLAGACVVTSFALAIGCHHEPAAPPPMTPVMTGSGEVIDGGMAPLIDAAGPAGGGNSPGFPGTNQP